MYISQFNIGEYILNIFFHFNDRRIEPCNDKTNYIRTLTTDRISLYIEIHVCKLTRLRHRYLLTTESMRRMPKALVNNRSDIIVGSCKQTMLLSF